VFGKEGWAKVRVASTELAALRAAAAMAIGIIKVEKRSLMMTSLYLAVVIAMNSALNTGAVWVRLILSRFGSQENAGLAVVLNQSSLLALESSGCDHDHSPSP